MIASKEGNSRVGAKIAWQLNDNERFEAHNNQRNLKNQDALKSTYSAYREAFSQVLSFGVKASALGGTNTQKKKGFFRLMLVLIYTSIRIYTRLRVTEKLEQQKQDDLSALHPAISNSHQRL
ncbi:hypothetical protein PV326_014446 [Microctonus aethiopoides]|nr:hypothetical protein PV326_014446 [Microctonus aethiopoides]